MDPNFKLLNQAKSAEMRLVHQADKLKKLGLLENGFPVVLVAGTNGKGSTANLLAQIAIASGLTVGLNSSPHLQTYNERIQIDRKPISDDLLQQILQQIEADFEPFLDLNYPEYSFLLALYTFRHLKVDLGVFEIGLGGRQDPANVLPADLSIITNIDYDHMAILGNTLEKIAYEKAGIIKQNKPFICGHAERLEPIAHEAKLKQANYFQINQDFAYQSFQQKYNLPEPSIVPSNAACAILAAEQLIPKPQIKAATEGFKLNGRLQEVNWKCATILDVAHNPGSCKVLASKINTLKPKGKTIAIFAVSNSKDISKMLEIISPHIDRWILPAVTYLAAPASLSPQIPNAELASSVKVVLNKLESEVSPNDLLIIFGSFYLIGEALCSLSEYSASSV